MNILRRLGFLALVVAYFLWPYHSVKKFTAAVGANDSNTLASMIDADAFAESMKDLIADAAILAAEDRAGGRSFDKEAMRAKFRQSLESGPFASMIGEQLKPERMARQMLAAKANGGGGDSISRTEKWVNPVTFAVYEPGTEGRAIFKFRGTGWKLAGVEMPQKELRRYMAMAGQMNL